VLGRHGQGVISDTQISDTDHTHPNARLTTLSREQLVRRHIAERVPLDELAFQAVISFCTAYKRLTRFRAGGPTELRHERCTMRHISKALDAPLSTIVR